MKQQITAFILAVSFIVGPLASFNVHAQGTSDELKSFLAQDIQRRQEKLDFKKAALEDLEKSIKRAELMRNASVVVNVGQLGLTAFITGWVVVASRPDQRLVNSLVAGALASLSVGEAYASFTLRVSEVKRLEELLARSMQRIEHKEESLLHLQEAYARLSVASRSFVRQILDTRLEILEQQELRLAKLNADIEEAKADHRNRRNFVVVPYAVASAATTVGAVGVFYLTLGPQGGAGIGYLARIVSGVIGGSAVYTGLKARQAYRMGIDQIEALEAQLEESKSAILQEKLFVAELRNLLSN